MLYIMAYMMPYTMYNAYVYSITYYNDIYIIIQMQKHFLKETKQTKNKVAA